MNPSEMVRQVPCLVCGSRTVDACHVRSRGAGGCNEVWNLMPLCRVHHVLQHKIGIVSFWRGYPAVPKWLMAAGWELVNELGRERLRNPKHEILDQKEEITT